METETEVESWRFSELRGLRGSSMSGCLLDRGGSGGGILGDGGDRELNSKKSLKFPTLWRFEEMIWAAED